jgi:predicted Zn-dependent peptidase
MINIQNYFERYYVPSNMAVCLSGDLEFDDAIALVDRTFGQWERRELIPWEVPPIASLGEDKSLEVYGLEAEQLMMGWRMPGADPYQSALALMVDGILSNGQAGLVDLNLVQAQKVLDAGTYFYELDDYSAFMVYGNPRDGQTLEELQALLEAQVQQVVDGEFPDWLIEAVANTQFLQRIRKEQVVQFARTIFQQPHVVVYKRKGEDPNVLKVEKPPITPVEANREAVSPYVQQFMKRKVDRVKPVFVNYKEAINDSKLSNGIAFSSIRNADNDLFQLYYILDMGRDHDPYLPHAINYLPFLGVDTASAADLAKAFYRLGLDFDVSAGDERVYVSLRGLGDNLEAGVQLFEYILANAEPDAQAWSDYVDGVLKKRQDAKTSKSTILWRALYDYARYEGQGPYLDKLSEAELRSVDPAELVQRIKDLSSYEHRIFYYGAERPSKVMALLNREHQVPQKLRKIPDPTEYVEAETGSNKVYFVHYDMVQAQMVMMAKGPEFDKKLAPMADLFNSYFGSGLSSIVFQEIRETRALAYSAFAAFSTPPRKDEAHWLRAYVATQADKLPEAIPAMQALLEDMPKADRQFQAARESVLKRIETDRITKTGMYWSRENNARRGIKYDFRENVYNTVSDADLADLDAFFQDQIADNTYTYLVLGDRELVDMDLLRSLGDFSELSLEAIFGY